jgi:hypothetical protein
MSERTVSDLVFRDLEPEAAARRTDAEREAALREQLVKLRPADSGPRVIPAARDADRERPR